MNSHRSSKSVLDLINQQQTDLSPAMNVSESEPQNGVGESDIDIISNELALKTQRGGY